MRGVLRNILILLVVTGLGYGGYYGGYYFLADPRRAEAVQTDTVVLDDIRFDAPVASVAAGTTVTWVFADDQTHNVVGDDWQSPNMIEGEWSHTFDQPGTYDYVCTLHSLGMRGRVVVTQ